MLVAGGSTLVWGQVAPLANVQFGWALPTDWMTSIGIGIGMALLTEAVLYALRDDGVYQGKLLADHIKEYRNAEKDLDGSQRRALTLALQKAGINTDQFAMALSVDCAAR